MLSPTHPNNCTAMFAKGSAYMIPSSFGKLLPVGKERVCTEFYQDKLLLRETKLSDNLEELPIYLLSELLNYCT